MARYFAWILAVAAVLLGCSAEAQKAADPTRPPLTRDGHPDLQGVWGWAFLTPMERPPGVKNLVLAPEEASAVIKEALARIPDLVDPDTAFLGINTLLQVDGSLRTSLVVKPDDGHLPFTDKALSDLKAANERTKGYDNPEERPMSQRCLAGAAQAPIRPLRAFIPMQIVQTGSDLVMMAEDVAGLRIIHLDGRPPPPDVVRSFEGYSAGHWEGATLVIETTHLRADDITREYIGRSIMVGPQSRILE